MDEVKQHNRREFFKTSGLIAGGIVVSNLPFSKTIAKGYLASENIPNVFIVSNMHPASCGWVDNFSLERNYCANNYFAHMDKVNEDASYDFVISEVNNMIAMLNFKPARFDELKNRLGQKRIEAVNGMFLELTPNLSGGEAIVRMGIHGIHWQKEVLDIRPRFNWMIDITGFHEQLAQISAGLGLEAMVHCRMNVSGSPLYFAESPDGTKLLTISPGHYASWPIVYSSLIPLKETDRQNLALEVKSKDVLGEMSYLVLGGDGDYSLPPKCPQYPTNFINAWDKSFHNSKLKFSTLGTYLDSIKSKLISKEIIIPTVKKGWGYSWDAFWVENPKVKILYRTNEHALQSAEKLATIASLNSSYNYPTQDLYHAWLQLHLNTDRNTLWGAAGGVVFEDKESWDALDRFNWITNQTNKIRRDVLEQQDGKYLSWFNPLNWQHAGPQYINPIEGKDINGFKTQKIGDKILFFPKLSSFGMGSFELTEGVSKASYSVALPEVVKNKFYEIKIDPITGEFTNLRLIKSKKNIINNGNILCADKKKGEGPIYHNLPGRKDRVETASTRDKAKKIKFFRGELAQIIKITSSLFHENDVQQSIIVYNDHPRIDFDIYLEDLPDKTITFMDFISEYGIIDENRGIPYGFTTESAETLSLREEGVHPVICWSSYSLKNGGGFAILDRGLPGREITGKKVSIMLNATSDIYMGLPSGWLSGKGKHHFQFSLVAFDDEDHIKQIQQLANEYNSLPFFENSARKIEENSFISTSDNIIIESLQRISDEVEIRFVECKGVEGTAKLTINFPVTNARLTNFLGEGDDNLSGKNQYLVSVRPQQIVTMRLKTQTNVDAIQPLKDWSPLVPKDKRKLLMKYDETLIGHPPY